MADILEAIARLEWRFARNHANTNPHQYSIRGTDNASCFDALSEHIRKNGHREWFFNKRGDYCAIGEYTYWITRKTINRRWNDMYYLSPTKRILKVPNWKELLNDGRAL